MGHQLVQGFPLFFPSTNPMNQPLWHSLASEMSVSRNRLLRTKAVSMAPGVLFTIGPTVLQHLQRSDTFRRGKCRNKHEENYENPKKPVTSHDVWSPIPGLKLDFTYTLIIRLMCAMWSGLASLWFINHHESHPHQHPPTLFTPPTLLLALDLVHQATLLLELTLQLQVLFAPRWQPRLQVWLQDHRGIFGGLVPTCLVYHPSSQNSNGSQPKEKASSLGIYPSMETTSVPWVYLHLDTRPSEKKVFCWSGLMGPIIFQPSSWSRRIIVPKCLFPPDIPWSR